MPKSIAMILDEPFPPDIRVRKEIETLVRAGFQVDLLCERPANDATYSHNGFETFYADVPSRDSLAYRVDQFIGLASFVFPRWKREIKKFLARRDYLAVHVHDLKIAGTVKACLNSSSIPFVLDMHENMPAAFAAWNEKRTFLRKLIFGAATSYGVWRNREKILCEFATRIVAVVDEMKQRLIRVHGIDAEKIFVVPNTESLGFASTAPTKSEASRDTFKLIYVGKINHHRGLEVVLSSVPYLIGKVPNLEIEIVGTGPDSYMKRLVRLTDELQIKEVVHFVGWQPFEKVSALIENADIALIPHLRNEHTDSTIPHKLFQYFMVGCPVLASDCPPLKRYIEASRAGLVFFHDSPESFASQVERLFSDPEERRQMSVRGRQFTLEEGQNWEATSQSLVELYQSNLKPQGLS